MAHINNHRDPAAEASSGAGKSKHKYFDSDPEQNPHKPHEKRQKSVSETEPKTLTLRPCRNPSKLPISNRFQQIRFSSHQRRRRKHHHHGRNSINFEFNREWVFSSRDLSAYKDRVVVASYNVLGVENASKHPDLYSKVLPEFLEWDRRKELICKELNHYNAGIVCFQEVDRFDDLDELLQKDGYRGVYKARTCEASDGCAIFWKDDRFTLLHEETIEFQNFGLRNNVAQLCILKMSHNQPASKLCQQTSETAPKQCPSLVIGNIHVLFNPNRGDIKLGQVRLFLENAHKLSQQWGSIPVLLGGDLNSLPQSAIYQFLASSKLDILLHDRRNISGQLEHPPQYRDFRSQNKNKARVCMSVTRPFIHRWSEEEIRLATGSEGVTDLQHQLNLSSAYFGVPGSYRSRDNCGEPLATSYHSRFMGTVDYIWHTQELVPVRVLETLPIDILRRSAGLPNKRWGSDHLALVCELAFLDDGDWT